MGIIVLVYGSLINYIIMSLYCGFVALLVVIFNISCLILGIIILVIVLADYIMVIGVYYLMVYYYIVGIIRV